MVGVEFSEKGVKRFFETYNIEFSVHNVDSVDGVKYEVTTSSLLIVLLSLDQNLPLFC